VGPFLSFGTGPATHKHKPATTTPLSFHQYLTAKKSFLVFSFSNFIISTVDLIISKSNPIISFANHLI
jgi:hypothetical protein